MTESEASYNPFAYCENEPVNGWDPSGNVAFTLLNCMLIGVATGTVIGTISGIYYGYRSGLRGWRLAGNAFKSGIYWATNGALMGSAIYAIYGAVANMFKSYILAVSKTGAASATVSILRRLPNSAITKALSNTSRLNHAFSHVGKAVTGQIWNTTTTFPKWKRWIEYGLKNCTAIFLNKLGKENVTGYYICRNGKNYAIYIYTSGKYQGLVATVVELTKKNGEIWIMVNNTITTTSFSICGYFHYPIVENALFSNFIKKVSDIEEIELNIELIILNKNKVNHTLLFETGDYLVANSTNLNLLESDGYTPLSIFFKNKYNLTSQILIKPVDYDGYEINYMLENDELDACIDKSLIIQELAQIFFNVFSPLYGGCGIELFLDGIKNIDENDIINTKFFNIGYVDSHVMSKFKFINDKHNIKDFHVVSLQRGNMYLNKRFSDEQVK